MTKFVLIILINAVSPPDRIVVYGDWRTEAACHADAVTRFRYFTKGTAVQKRMPIMYCQPITEEVDA